MGTLLPTRMKITSPLIAGCFLFNSLQSGRCQEAGETYISDAAGNKYYLQDRNQFGPGVLESPSSNSDLSGSPSLYSNEDDPFLASEHGSHGSRGKYRRRKKGKKRIKKRPIIDDYYDEYYDRDDSYGAPLAPSSGYDAPSSSYDAPSSSYNAPSYEAPSYEAPSSEYKAAPSSSYGAPSYGGDDDGFNDFLNALAAFLPIGLFLAAIPPNLITISTKKKRSINEINEVEQQSTYPFMEKIMKIGMGKFLLDADCQKQIFCEMSQKGRTSDANWVQKSIRLATIM